MPEPEKDAAHDVLAAEAFAVPAADPSLHSRPVVLPDDPSGIAEPHDVLAAEEFAMPAVQPRVSGVLARRAGSSRWLAAVASVAVALVALRLLRRR